MELAEVRFQFLVLFRILTIRCVVELVASHHVLGGDRFEGKLIEERHGQCHEESLRGSTGSGIRRGGQSFHCNELQNREVRISMEDRVRKAHNQESLVPTNLQDNRNGG